MAVPYHSHTFDIPTATPSEVATATEAGKAVTPASMAEITALAASAVQPGDLGDSAGLDVGTTAGTVAAGNDSRIVGALQKAANLSDLADAEDARENLDLGNVDNTSDLDKPVSAATQSQLDLLAPKANPEFSGTAKAPLFQGSNRSIGDYGGHYWRAPGDEFDRVMMYLRPSGSVAMVKNNPVTGEYIGDIWDSDVGVANADQGRKADYGLEHYEGRQYSVTIGATDQTANLQTMVNAASDKSKLRFTQIGTYTINGSVSYSGKSLVLSFGPGAAVGGTNPDGVKYDIMEDYSPADYISKAVSVTRKFWAQGLAILRDGAWRRSHYRTLHGMSFPGLTSNSQATEFGVMHYGIAPDITAQLPNGQSNNPLHWFSKFTHAVFMQHEDKTGHNGALAAQVVVKGGAKAGLPFSATNQVVGAWALNTVVDISSGTIGYLVGDETTIKGTWYYEPDVKGYAVIGKKIVNEGTFDGTAGETISDGPNGGKWRYGYHADANAIRADGWFLRYGDKFAVDANGDIDIAGGSWAAYTPVVTAFSGSFGSASATGAYKRIGKTLLVRLNVQVATVGTAATELRASLPSGMSAKEACVLNGHRVDGNPKVVAAVSFVGESYVRIVNTDGSFAGNAGANLVVTGVVEIN